MRARVCWACGQRLVQYEMPSLRAADEEAIAMLARAGCGVVDVERWVPELCGWDLAYTVQLDERGRARKSRV